VSRKKNVLLDESLSPLERLRRSNTPAYNKAFADSLDQSSVSNQIGPDHRFLLKRTLAAEDADRTDAYRRALVDLLRNWKHLGVPLSQVTLDTAAAELERAWWPNSKAERARRLLDDALSLHLTVKATEAWYRQKGDPHPRGAALAEVARALGYNSAGALSKALQPGRSRVRFVDRKPRG
jgi:hypothetical protein